MGSDDTRVFLPVDEPLTPVGLAIVERLLNAQGLHIVDAEGTALIAEGARLLALAQAENERLQAINAHLSADIAAKVHDHREEVDRLRAESEEYRRLWRLFEPKAEHFEASLAAANALLEMCDGETDSTDVQTALTDYFAAQPATALTDGSCDICARVPVRPMQLCGTCRDVIGAEKRTEAEQRVLDAMGAASERDLRQMLANGRATAAGEAAKAELARRGLKP